MKQLLLDIKPPPLPTLQNFQPGQNTELLTMLKHIVNGQEKEQFIYLWGKTGCGKSHLLKAMQTAYLQNNQQAIYSDHEINSQHSADNIPDCIIVDNVDQLDEAAQIALFNLYNDIRDHSHTVLLCSGVAAPAQLTAMRPDLTTRLGWGLVYQVHELTDDDKILAMNNYADRCGFKLPQEVSRYLLRHERRDLPSLIRTLDALDQYSLSKHRPMTISLLQEVLHLTA